MGFGPQIVLLRLPSAELRRTQYLRLCSACYALELNSNSTVGMTGFDSVILAVFAAVRDCDGSRYPHVTPLSAKDKLATFKNAFADFRMPALAVA